MSNITLIVITEQQLHVLNCHYRTAQILLQNRAKFKTVLKLIKQRYALDAGYLLVDTRKEKNEIIDGQDAFDVHRIVHNKKTDIFRM